jgi:hypothetical protein
MTEHLIPYAVKRGKAGQTPAKRAKALRAWKPDPGFSERELKDVSPRVEERTIPRKPRLKRAKG